MKAVIYSRVSTEEQTTQNQIEVLKSWASQLRMDFTSTNPEAYEVKKIYEESESAWKEGHQRELPQLFHDASQGKFKILLVWALDRLTRQGVQAQFEIMHRLATYGVQVFSYQETWTLTPNKPEYDLLLAIAAYIAQSESKRRSERTKAGLMRARKEGKKLGRPKGCTDTRKRKSRRCYTSNGVASNGK